MKWLMNKIKNFFKGSPRPNVENTPAQYISEKEVIGYCQSILKDEWISLVGLIKINSSVDYWVRFFTALSYVESGYNSSCVFPEPQPLGYDSIGLLQLSEVDFKNYSYPKFPLKDGYQNIRFGIYILNELAKKKGQVIFDKDHYWSTLRPGRNPKQYAKFIEKMNQINLS